MRDADADEVDRLVAAWGRVLPALDASPMLVLSRISRLSHHLDRARKEAFLAHDLEGWEFDVLSALRRAGAPFELSPKALVAETLVTSGTMTTRIDKLVRRELVTRKQDARDRRGVLVRLAPAGAEHVDGAVRDLLEREDELIAMLEVDEREHLATTLARALRPFES